MLFLVVFYFDFDNYISFWDKNIFNTPLRGEQEVEVQKIHVGSTPRIGGIAILAGLCVCLV